MSHDRTIHDVTAEPRDRQIAATLAAAFQDDPALSWIQPDPEARRKLLPRFFRVTEAQSIRHGHVLASEDRGAASLWYPPGAIADNRLVEMWDSLRFLAYFKGALGRGLAVAEAMYAQHPQPQPYVYLRYVGVAPEAQGKGWGGAIIRAGVARAAEHGLGVLLETATESNVAIYSRLGFEITSEWHVPKGGPKFWTMVHPAP